MCSRYYTNSSFTLPSFRAVSFHRWKLTDGSSLSQSSTLVWMVLGSWDKLLSSRMLLSWGEEREGGGERGREGGREGRGGREGGREGGKERGREGVKRERG